MLFENEGKILYISSIDISIGNGPGVNEREFIIALAKRLNRRAYFIIPQPSRNLPEIDSINYIPLKIKGVSRIYRYLNIQISQFISANKFLSNNNIDLIIFRLDFLPITQYIIARTFKKPFALKTLGVGIVEGTKLQRGLKGILGKVLYPFNFLLIKYLSKKALAIDAPTSAMIEGNRKRFNLDKRKMLTIPNATNTDRFKPGDFMTAKRICNLDRFSHIIGYTGGRPQKRGARQLIQIAPKLLKVLPKIGIVIVGGSQADIKGLQAMAASLNLSDCITFTGQIPYEQVPIYINSLQVGFCFDEDDAVLNKGLSSQKLCQYLAAGCPVISDNPDSAFLETADIGSVVDRRDIDSIAENVLKWLILSENERDDLRKRAVRYASENLSVDHALLTRLNFWQARLSQEQCQG